LGRRLLGDAIKLRYSTEEEGIRGTEEEGIRGTEEEGIRGTEEAEYGLGGNLMGGIRIPAWVELALEAEG
jgi:hypothetical protein